MLKYIHILGLDRPIEAPTDESILQCGLRAGLNLAYHCERGSCGGCGARLIRGEIQRLFHHDFTFTARDQAAGWFLTCAHAAASDLEIEITGFAEVGSLPLQSLPTLVRRVHKPDPEHLLLQLRSPRSAVLRFIAGQAVDLELPQIGRRRYFLANCPCDAINPLLHLRRRPGDRFSEHVFAALKPGDRVQLHGPFGDLVLPPEPRSPLLLICWETGFAAIQSLLEQALALGLEQPIRVLWFSRDAGGRYLRNYCRALVDAEDRVSYAGVDLVRADDLAEALAANLEQSGLGQGELAPGGLAGVDVFAVVSPTQADSVRSRLLAAGATAQRLRIATSAWI